MGTLHRHQSGEERRDDPVGPVGRAIDAARELLGLELVCVSGILGGAERRQPNGATGAPVPEDALTIPLESAEGRLYGSLVCRTTDPAEPLDDRDHGFLRVLGRLVGSQIERDERELERHRSGAEAAGMQALLAAVDAHDRYTAEHSRSVVDLAIRVARRVGLREREVAQVEQVALLHDVGKVAIPDTILLKPGPLDMTEARVVRQHAAIGARIVASVSGLAHLAPAIRSSHERWDGRGYPDGLCAEEIPFPSRIAAVCDAYDAMVSRRPYRGPLGPKAALEEVRRCAGSQFCPEAAGALDVVLARGGTLRRSRFGASVL